MKKCYLSWWKKTDRWIPVIGILIAFPVALWLLRLTQKWVTLYQIEPIVAFLALNILGISAIYLGIKAKNWASKH